MSENALKGWLYVTVLALIFCLLGWYSSASNASDSISPKSDVVNSSETVTVDEYENTIDEYKSTISEANDRIESVNSCISDAYDLFDSGYFDDGQYELDNCYEDTVSEPF